MNRVLLLVVSMLVLLICGASTLAQTPSFDCSKATSVDEHLICSDTNLARLDTELSTIFLQTRDTIPVGGRSEIVQDQKAWIVRRNKECGIARNTKLDDANRPGFITCFSDKYSGRISYLQNLYKSQPAAARDQTGSTDAEPKQLIGIPSPTEAKSEGSSLDQPQTTDQDARPAAADSVNGEPVEHTNTSSTDQAGKVVPNPVPAHPVDPAAVELSFWDSIKGSTDAADFQEYLNKYPTGQFVSLAQRRLASLAQPKPTPIPAVQPHNMEGLFSALLFASLIGLCLALINPRWATGNRIASRPKAAGMFGAAFIAIALVGGTIFGTPHRSEPPAAPAPDEETIKRQGAEGAAAEQKAAADKAKRQAEITASILCEDEFKQQAAHPSTVDFPVFDKFRGREWHDDLFIYEAGPTAKNSFNLEIRFHMICNVRAGKIVAFNVEEAN